MEVQTTDLYWSVFLSFVPKCDVIFSHLPPKTVVDFHKSL
jgi:hypothetical protein